MARTHADKERFENGSDYGRHVSALRNRARRPDPKVRHGRFNQRLSAIKQNVKDTR